MHRYEMTYRVAVECDVTHHKHAVTVAAFLSTRSPRQGSSGLFEVDTPWRLEDRNADIGERSSQTLAVRGAGLDRPRSHRTAHGWTLPCLCGDTLAVRTSSMALVLDRLRDAGASKISLNALRRRAT